MHVTFSVVIATYNEREYLLETVRSVIEQTYPAHEIIVVCDGCSDGSADAVRQTFPSVHVIEQPNLGKGIARNTGTLHASGDWICFLDHDELFHRKKLEVIADYLKSHGDCSAVNHGTWLFVTDQSEGVPGFKPDFVAKGLEECHAIVANSLEVPPDCSRLMHTKDSLSETLDRKFAATSALVVKRDIVIRAGGFCPMQFNGEDWTLSVNVARLCDWHTVPLRLGFARLHTRSGSNDKTGGLMLLGCYINAWFTGWPLRSRSKGLDFLDNLARRRLYRLEVQALFWGAIRRGEFNMARLIRSAGSLLLPRLADRFYIMIPPQITWRTEKYVFGMHRSQAVSRPISRNEPHGPCDGIQAQNGLGSEQIF